MTSLKDVWGPELDETIPVYLDTKNPARRRYPANTVVMNYEDKTVTRTSSSPSANDPAVTAVPKPEMKVSSLQIKDMSAVKAASARPSAIVIYAPNEDVTPQMVRVIFNYYRELFRSPKDSEGRRPQNILVDRFRTIKVNLKDPKPYTMYRLATLLGASVFTRAITMDGDTAPERTAVALISKEFGLVGNEEDKSVPYAVIPRVKNRADLVIPRGLGKNRGRIVYVDMGEGLGEVGVVNFGKLRRRPLKNPIKMVNSMISKTSSSSSTPSLEALEEGEGCGCDAPPKIPVAVLMSLTRLSAAHPDPSGLIFMNVSPTAVVSMLAFYQALFNGDDPGNDLWVLNQPGMEDIRFAFLTLASACGAEEFETTIRRRSVDNIPPYTPAPEEEEEEDGRPTQVSRDVSVVSQGRNLR